MSRHKLATVPSAICATGVPSIVFIIAVFLILISGCGTPRSLKKQTITANDVPSHLFALYTTIDGNERGQFKINVTKESVELINPPSGLAFKGGKIDRLEKVIPPSTSNSWIDEYVFVCGEHYINICHDWSAWSKYKKAISSALSGGESTGIAPEIPDEQAYAALMVMHGTNGYKLDAEYILGEGFSVILFDKDNAQIKPSGRMSLGNGIFVGASIPLSHRVDDGFVAINSNDIPFSTFAKQFATLNEKAEAEKKKKAEEEELKKAKEANEKFTAWYSSIDAADKQFFNTAREIDGEKTIGDVLVGSALGASDSGHFQSLARKAIGEKAAGKSQRSIKASLMAKADPGLGLIGLGAMGNPTPQLLQLAEMEKDANGKKVALFEVAIDDWLEAVIPPSPAPAEEQVRQPIETEAVTPQVASIAYVVKAGDTLTKIALEQLGSKDRWKDIKAVNPALDVTKPLTLGLVLKMPAK